MTPFELRADISTQAKEKPSAFDLHRLRAGALLRGDIQFVVLV
jgi:hypothetical protein